MKKSLFNIEQEFTELASAIIEAEGELTPELEKQLTINKNELQTKAVGYSKVIKQAKGEISIIDSEIKRLQSEKKKRKNIEDRLKQSLTEAMNIFEIDKIETPLCKVSFRKSETVEIEDIEKLPASVITIEKKASKSELKKLLKDGDVNGAKLVSNKSIQIK